MQIPHFDSWTTVRLLARGLRILEIQRTRAATTRSHSRSSSAAPLEPVWEILA